MVKGVFKFLSFTTKQIDTMTLPNNIKQTIESLAADFQGVIAA